MTRSILAVRDGVDHVVEQYPYVGLVAVCVRAFEVGLCGVGCCSSLALRSSAGDVRDPIMGGGSGIGLDSVGSANSCRAQSYI